MTLQKPKRALVLSGGNLKGAFQAGALPVVFETFSPDIIYGISVGSLNGAFLADRAGEATSQNKEVKWIDLAKGLETFWKENITNPDAIYKGKKLKLLWEIIRNRFDGILDTAPLKKLIKGAIKEKNLRDCPVPIKIGTVDMQTGQMFYADKEHQRILDFVYASSAIPGVFPPFYRTSNSTCIDGAMRASAPLSQAIKDGATEIVAVLCHAEDINSSNGNLRNTKNFFERLMDIFSNEQITNDVLIAQLRKKIFEMGNNFANVNLSEEMTELLGKQSSTLKIYVIRPNLQPEIKMENFSRKDIEALIERGRQRAKEVMDKKSKGLGFCV